MPEKSTITIEIKQEVSIIFLWLAGGICFATIAFFIPAQTNELWPQFYSAGIAAIVYLIALLVYILRKPVSAKARIVTMAISIMTLGAVILSSVQTDSLSHIQKNNLLQVRAIIGRGIMLSKLPLPLLETLKTFYRQESKNKETLSQIFQQLHGNATIGSNINKPAYDGDTLKIIVQTLEAYRVVLVAQETYIRGRNPEFINYNGQKGMIQEKCTLTREGVKYESEN